MIPKRHKVIGLDREAAVAQFIVEKQIIRSNLINIIEQDRITTVIWYWE